MSNETSQGEPVEPLFCLGCQRRLNVKPEHVGKKVRCPKCNALTAVPERIFKRKVLSGNTQPVVIPAMPPVAAVSNVVPLAPVSPVVPPAMPPVAPVPSNENTPPALPASPAAPLASPLEDLWSTETGEETDSVSDKDPDDDFVPILEAGEMPVQPPPPAHATALTSESAPTPATASAADDDNDDDSYSIDTGSLSANVKDLIASPPGSAPVAEGGMLPGGFGPPPPAMPLPRFLESAGKEFAVAAGASADRPLALPTSYHRVVKEQRERASENDAIPPERPFIDGVFDFPFKGENRLKLLHITLAGWCTGGMLAGALMVIALLSQTQLLAVTVVMLAGTAILGLWMLTLLAATMLTIVEETAAGANEIDYPTQGMADRLLPFWLMAFPLAIGMTLGWFLTVPLMFVPYFVVVMFRLMLITGVGFLLYPFLLLSMSESGSAFQVYSVPVFKSLKRHYLSWLKFYGLSTAICFPVFLFAAITWGAALFATSSTEVAGFTCCAPVAAVISGPLVAIAGMIYARLLGRLAWVVLADAGEEDQDDEDE